MTRRDWLKLALTTCGTAVCAQGSGLAGVLDFAPAADSSNALRSLQEVAASRGFYSGRKC